MTIRANHLLTEQQQREVLAALALQGLDQKTYAEREGISYQRLNRMINRREIVTATYARRMGRLIGKLSSYSHGQAA